jgi:3-deoxy-D-manno-octulosonate 8-phosphate phosphatase (KDO 8-P phosphatase)
MSDLTREQAAGVRAVLLDVDGVMTDGGLYLSSGETGIIEGRRFDVHDGMAVHMLRRAGIGVAVVSSKVSAAARARIEALEIEEVHQVSAFDKLVAVEGVLGRVGASWAEAAFLADDLADLPVLRKVGLPAAVANAVPEVKRASKWVGSRAGGAGAVREFVEAVLRARGEWEALVEAYVAECVERWRSAGE